MGECPDCCWYHQPEGCNVKRDSETCSNNKGIRMKKKINKGGESNGKRSTKTRW